MSSQELPGSGYYWQRVAEGYHEHLEAGLDPFQDDVNTPLVLAMLDPHPDDLIMDLGCGNGRFTRRIAQVADFVFGADQSETLVAYAKENETPENHLAFLEHDVSEPFPIQFHGMFDKVVAKMLFPSLTSDELCQVVINARNLLKPEGTLVISTLSPVYHEQYLKPKSETWRYFFFRDLNLEQLHFPEQAADIDKYSEAIYNLMEKYPGAVWVPVSKSPFRVPTYIHTDEEFIQILDQSGFRFIDKKPVIVTPEFAGKHPDYQDRVGMEIIVNMKLKGPLE